MERMAEKSVLNLLAAIDKSRHTTFARFLYALGVPLIGETTASALASNFRNIEALLSANLEDFIVIDDIGPLVAQSALDFFSEPRNRNIIKQLLDASINWPEPIIVHRDESSLFFGRTAVITGSFNEYSRVELKALLESAGAKVTGSVSKKTNYLIAGSAAGSKLDKAVALKVRVINEAELQQIMPPV
jgi:DNA ligase (NAD+)